MTDDEAFEGAIGMDVAAFNDAWLADLGAKEPMKYGPQPAPAGPRPAGWGTAPSVARGARGPDAAHPGRSATRPLRSRAVVDHRRSACRSPSSS